MIFDLKIKYQIILIFKKINLSTQQSQHIGEEKKKRKTRMFRDRHGCRFGSLKKTSQPMTG